MPFVMRRWNSGFYGRTHSVSPDDSEIIASLWSTDMSAARCYFDHITVAINLSRIVVCCLQKDCF